jgi:hypothetical protein
MAQQASTKSASVIAAVAGHQISDLASFNNVTADPRQVAGLYFYYKLDCLVDLAYAVSRDFYDRPELFTSLADGRGGSAVPSLAKLHARYGCDEMFLDRKQRGAIYAALFGASGEMSPSMHDEGNFPNLRDELMTACATFVETKFGDEVSLRENVRQKHRLFREYLTGLQGDSVKWSREQSLSAITEGASYLILRNRGVSAVYGIPMAPVDQWPYNFDANAAKLVEEISKRLVGWRREEMETDGKQMISREEITNLQRAAIEGAKAIATAIDVDAAATNAEVDLLIRNCYTWSTSLKSLNAYPRGASAVPSRAADKPRGAIAVAQPIAGAAATNRS